MTDHRSPLDAHTAAFRDELGRAAVRASRRRRRTRRTFSFAVPLAGVASLAIAFWPGEKVDLLERAAAALRPNTGVIHFRVDTGPIGLREPICLEEPADVWLETGPQAGEFPRWRFRDNSARCLTKGQPHGLGHIQTGRTETWFNGRDRSDHAIDDGWVETLTDVPETNTVRQLPDVTQLSGSGNRDPLETLRAMYASGEVRPAGQGVIGGRRVRFFSGPFAMTELDDTVRIAVDADSFVPVEVRVQAVDTPELRQRTDNAAIGFRVRFTAYDAATEEDLEPKLAPGTVRASMDYRAFRRAVRRTGDYPPEPISDAERARAASRLAEKAKSEQP